VAEKVSKVAAAERFRRKLGVTYPYVLDRGDRIFQKYGLNTHPTTVLVDANGVVRHVGEGFLRGDEKEIEAALKPLLRGVSPAQRVTARGRK
jgi:peroxiredoxin